MPFLVKLSESFECDFTLEETTKVYSDYAKQCILVHYFNGKKPLTIKVLLRREELQTTSGSFRRRPGSGRSSKVGKKV
jgi:hypothetical protein